MTATFCGSNPSTPRKKRRGLMQTLYSAIFGHSDTNSKKATKPTSPPSTVDNGASQSPQPLPIAPASPTSSIGTCNKTSYASVDFGDKVFELEEDVIIEEKDEGKDDESEYGSVQGEEEIGGGKTEQIIGKFYQQIRLQALNSIGATRS